jgi:hypothetical protein
MKKNIVLFSISLILLISPISNAQVHISIGTNITSQPMWGPTGYDHVEYYYLPDIDAYYYVPKRQYIYVEHGNWIFRSSLPRRYNNYNIYNGYKVVINEPQPYRQAENYRNKYGGFKGRRDQEVIRNSRDERYFENKQHPEHKNWKKANKKRH